MQCFCVDQYDETESAAVSMSKNAYANYVVKTALEVLEEGRQRDQLYSELLSNLAELVSVCCIMCMHISHLLVGIVHEVLISTYLCFLP